MGAPEKGVRHKLKITMLTMSKLKKDKIEILAKDEKL